MTGIVDIPPVLVDQSDEQDGGVLPPAATRRAAALLRVLLGGGPAGPRDRRDKRGLQHHLTTLAATVQRHESAAIRQQLVGLSFAVARAGHRPE